MQRKDWKCKVIVIVPRKTRDIVGKQVNKERLWKSEQTQQWGSFQNKDGQMNTWETKEQLRLTFTAATFSTHTSHRLLLLRGVMFHLAKMCFWMYFFFFKNQTGLVWRSQTEAPLFPGDHVGARWAMCAGSNSNTSHACLNGACEKIFCFDPPVTLLGIKEWKWNPKEIHRNTHYP